MTGAPSPDLRERLRRLPHLSRDEAPHRPARPGLARRAGAPRRRPRRAPPPRRGPARHHLGARTLARARPLRPARPRRPRRRRGGVLGRTPHAFEYWSHAACILPIEEWPWFAFRRRAYRARRRALARGAPRRRARRGPRRSSRAEGPLTTTELGGGRSGGEWWDWSEAKIAVEWLLDVGEVVCIERRGWRRVYDLAERASPPTCCATSRRHRVPDAASSRWPARRSAWRPRSDLADYHRLKGDQVDAVIARHRPGAGDGRGLGRAGLGRPGGARDAGPRGRHRDDAAVAVRLARSGTARGRADLRLRAPPRGLRARAQAGPRLLRDAAAGRRAARRPRRPRARGHDAGRQAGLVRAAAPSRMARRAAGGRRPGSAATRRARARRSRPRPRRRSGPRWHERSVDRGMRAYYEARAAEYARLVQRDRRLRGPAAARLGTRTSAT